MYWGSTNRPEHLLEIAICPDRVAGAYPAARVMQWIEREIDATGRRGAQHYGEASWPTLGFVDEDTAKNFLRRYGLIRKGLLNPDSLYPSVAATPILRLEEGASDAEASAPSGQSAAESLLRAYRRRTAGIPDTTVAYRRTKQRIGQALLRRTLIDVWGGRCAVTGLSVLPLLRASHIKPWAESSDGERLNAQNALLLTPNLDAAFDGGFISFDAEGGMVVSSALGVDGRALFGLQYGPLRIPPSEEQQQFLAWHQRHRFRGD